VENESKKKHKLSSVSSFHYFRLIFRSALFLAGVWWYIYSRMHGIVPTLSSFSDNRGKAFLLFLWAVFMLEMILRFFPSKLESPGCQKQFAGNYKPTGRTDVLLHDNSAAVMVMLIWLSFNGIIGALYLNGIIDQGILLLVCMAYSICDMICILFFCPFQTWFLRNKCCCTCRIYNWDYAMMFTPLFFVGGWFAWSLLAAAVALLFRWEITVWRYPERFSENTNEYLACANCTERLCMHKEQLTKLRKSLREQAEATVERIRTGHR